LGRDASAFSIHFSAGAGTEGDIGCHQMMAFRFAFGSTKCKVRWHQQKGSAVIWRFWFFPATNSRILRPTHLWLN
jgi:hypothetical protein